MKDKIRRRERVKKLREIGYKSDAIMNIIRYEDSGVDITNICGPEFSFEQIKEIYLAIRHNVDAGILLDPSIPAIYMKWMRKYLKAGIDIDVSTMLKTSITCIKDCFYTIKRNERSEGNLSICG